MNLKPTTRLGIWVGGLLFAGLAAVFALLQIPVVSVPALVAIAVAYVLEPMITAWEARGYTRTSALILIGAGFVTLLGTALTVLPGWLEHQWELVQAQAPQAIARASEAIAAAQVVLHRDLPFLGEIDLIAAVDRLGAVIREDVLPQIPVVLAQTVLGALMVPIIAFFILKDGRNARKGLLEWVPNRHFEMALNIFHRMDEQVGAYLRGVLLEALLVGSTAFAVLLLFGVPGAGLIGLVVGITNLIPYFGPVSGLVTGVAYCVLAGAPESAFLGVLAAVGIAQLADNLVIGPTVIGKAVDVHALVVILLLLVAGNLFGLIGLVIAVPLWAVIRVVVQETVSAVGAYGRYMVD